MVLQLPQSLGLFLSKSTANIPQTAGNRTGYFMTFSLQHTANFWCTEIKLVFRLVFYKWPLDAQSVPNEQWDFVFAVTVQLKFDALHKDKLTFPSHAGTLRSGTVRTGNKLSLYFVWLFPFKAREVHHFTSLGHLGGSEGQNLPGEAWWHS